VKVQDLSEVIATSLRKTAVVIEEPKSVPSEEEEELSDPMDLETEEMYIRAFDLDSSHSDAAMREAGDDWSQMDKEKQKSLNKQEFVEKKSRQYVKTKKSSYVRTRISEALKSQRDTRRRRPSERIERCLKRHRRRRRRKTLPDPALRRCAG
jgi:hypothetical protein